MNGPTLTIAISSNVKDESPVILVIEQDDIHMGTIYLTREEATQLATSLSTAVGLTAHHRPMAHVPPAERLH